MKDIYRSGVPGKDIGQYLDQNSKAYLESIPVASDILESRFHPLGSELKNPDSILTIGVGSGEEVQTLSEMFPKTTIYGVDLSQVALAKSKDVTQDKDGKVEYMVADAQNLPFDEKSHDAVVMSALLHEVYSYSPDGNQALANAIQEASRVIKPEGVILIRDPKTPELRSQVDIQFQTQIAIDFYKYFKNCFRMHDEHPKEPRFPEIIRDNFLQLSSFDTAELLLHFRNFWHAYSANSVSLFDLDWKELRERYLPISNNGRPLLINEYIRYVEEVANQSPHQQKQTLRNIRSTTSSRPKTDVFLQDHFALSVQDSEDLSSFEITQKMTQTMELMFKKI